MTNSTSQSQPSLLGIVTNPFQVTCFLELVHHLQLPRNQCTLLLRELEPICRKQIRIMRPLLEGINVYELSSEHEAIQIQIPILRLKPFLNEVTSIVRKHKPYFLAFGSYDPYSPVFPNACGAATTNLQKIFWLDEGAGTVTKSSEYLNPTIPDLKTRGKNIIYSHLVKCRFEYPTQFTYFSAFGTSIRNRVPKSTEVIDNQFEFLKRIYTEKGQVQNNAYFLGQCLDHPWGEEQYHQTLRDVYAHISCIVDEVTYIPHRREDDHQGRIAAKILQAKFLRLPIPFELWLAQQDTLPKQITSLWSTGLIVSRQVLPDNISVTAYRPRDECFQQPATLTKLNELYSCFENKFSIQVINLPVK